MNPETRIQVDDILNNNNSNQFPLNSYFLSVIEQLYSLTQKDVPFDDFVFRTLSEEFIGHYEEFLRKHIIL
jgi:hypothetical protein